MNQPPRTATLPPLLENGSVAIPVFILPHALNARAEHLGQQVLQQLGRSAAPGVFKPGIVVAIQGDGYIDLRETLVDGLQAMPAAVQPYDDLEMRAGTLLAAGPAGLLVLCADTGEMLEVAARLGPQPVAVLHMDDGDAALAAQLMPQLKRMARRVYVNSFTPPAARL